MFSHNTGKALNSKKQIGTKLTYITTSNVYWDKFELVTLKEMSFTEAEIEKCTAVKGDLLVCEGGDIGRSAIWKRNEPIRIQNHIHRLRVYVNICVRFYYHILYLYKQIDRINGKGIGIQGLSANQLNSIIFPVPPVPEQYRISGKIDECLNFIDEIETDKETIQRVISTTRNHILDLAIRGKLVPQDPNDEPASVLLERIRAEKEELIKQGKIKRDKKESVIFKGEDNSYYGVNLPENWEATTLKNISSSIRDGSHNPPTDSSCGIPILSATNIFDNKVNVDSASRWLSEKDWIEENKRTNLELNDLLLTIVGSIGRAAVLKEYSKFALQRSVAVIKPILANPEYLMFFFESPRLINFLDKNSKGTAQKGIYLNTLNKMIIFIPPLAEQNRIVDTIKTCFAQLDNVLL